MPCFLPGPVTRPFHSAMRPPCRCFSRRYHWGIALPCHEVTPSQFPVTLRPPHFLPPLGSPSVRHFPLGRLSPPPAPYSQWVPPTRDFLPLETVLEEGGGTRPSTPEGESSPKLLCIVLWVFQSRNLNWIVSLPSSWTWSIFRRWKVDLKISNFASVFRTAMESEQDCFLYHFGLMSSILFLSFFL